MAKNKIKTHKASAKRFKVTAKGKLKHSRQGYNHLRTKKTSAHKSRLGGEKTLNSTTETKKIKKLIGA